MKWEKSDIGLVPVKSWCETLEPEALKQAINLANHPAIFSHVALMPDCHVGYGMPIGGVAAFDGAIVPNAVGVDIGCGMGAVQTSLRLEELGESAIKEILHDVKRSVPCGEGRAHGSRQAWERLDERTDDRPGGIDSHGWNLAYCNLGTLGGGNHFIEMQVDQQGAVWMMIHSGSRNLGYRIAEHYHALALQLNLKMGVELPDRELAFLPLETQLGQDYARDMAFALDYARENRRLIMAAFKRAVAHRYSTVEFVQEINIHHNYAAEELHGGKKVWVHRKGATSAKDGELGIIPGSMGTPSYIVRGRGNSESFASCSHGAGRVMGRKEACRSLSLEDCEKAMSGIVFEGFKLRNKKGWKGRGPGDFDLEEAPQAYKDIDMVIESELDLIEPVVKLRPVGVIKG